MTAQSTNEWMRLAAVVAVVTGAVGGAATGWPVPFVVLLVTGLALALFIRVRLSVRSDTVDLALTFGIPRWRLRRDEIAGARLVEVNPWRFGGWGLRLVRGGWAIVIKGGPAIEFAMADGRRVIVTVDDPASVLRDLSH